MVDNNDQNKVSPAIVKRGRNDSPMERDPVQTPGGSKRDVSVIRKPSPPPDVKNIQVESPHVSPTKVKKSKSQVDQVQQTGGSSSSSSQVNQDTAAPQPQQSGQPRTKAPPGQPRDPSRKMRQNKCCRQHLELLKSDLYGASYGNVTETIFD